MFINLLNNVLNVHLSNFFEKKSFWGHKDCMTKSNYYPFEADCVWSVIVKAQLKLNLEMISVSTRLIDLPKRKLPIKVKFLNLLASWYPSNNSIGNWHSKFFSLYAMFYITYGKYNLYKNILKLKNNLIIITVTHFPLD